MQHGHLTIQQLSLLDHRILNHTQPGQVLDLYMGLILVLLSHKLVGRHS